MKLLHWNIQHGGGPKRMPHIALSLLAHAPDIVALTEFRTATGGQIAGVLHDHGLRFQTHTNPEARSNGVLIASRFPTAARQSQTPVEACSRRLSTLTITHPTIGLCQIVAAHIPDARRCDRAQMSRKSLHWQDLLRIAKCPTPTLVLGDLNTGRPGIDEQGHTLTSAAMLGKLSTMGYIDPYRRLHPRGRTRSWFAHTGTGFRLDHILVSQHFDHTIRAAGYSESELNRRLSDHAIVWADLDLDDCMSDDSSTPIAG